MDAPGVLSRFLDRLDAYGDRTALMHFRSEDVETLSYQRLTQRIDRQAAGILKQGLEPGESVALFAAGGIAWIEACLALVRAGAVPVPLDTQIEDEGLQRILEDCEAHWIFSDRRSARRLEAIDHGCRVVLLDGDWEDWAVEPAESFPAPEPEDRALLFYTSGTTGPPKGVPLTHRQLAYQIDVLGEADLVREDDRLLLPLPPHHVYPLVVGILAPLALGLTIILPSSLTGPQLLRALEEGEATALIGVPRIYEALIGGVEQRIEARGTGLGSALRLAIAACVWARRQLRLDWGGVLLRPLRERIGPRLRVLVSGGSALAPDLAWRLRGLGFEVASGYGLTETAPLVTINPPDTRRLESVGKAVRDTEIRIDRSAHPERPAEGEAEDEAESEEEAQHNTGEKAGEEGEILVRGPGVFDGYLHLEDETRDAFTEDGWFRTGDLGWLDPDGYLFVSGRKSTLIVSSSGEKIRTEEVEKHVAQHVSIEEIGVLWDEDALAAVVVPAREALRDEERETEDTIREALGSQGASMPSHQRISRFVVSRAPLERTRLGKIRRHRLRERYAKLREGEGEPARERPMSIEEMSPEDQQLVEDPRAREAWDLLEQRFADRGLTPDSDMKLDLGLDSLGWLDLGFELASRTGVELEEERMSRIGTVRELLEEIVEASPGEGEAMKTPVEEPDRVLDDTQKRWLAPLPAAAFWLARMLSSLNRGLMRWLFRLEVRGVAHLPRAGPVLIAPNHTSYLDPFALAAAMPESIRERVFWGGWTGIAFKNRIYRGLSRLARTFPVDPDRAARTSLAFGAAVLERRGHLVWFPEGQRSRSGSLLDLRPGIGRLLETWDDVTVVPVQIEGTHAAWPVGQRFPRRARVRVTFGAAQKPDRLAERGDGDTDADRITRGLHAAMRELGEEGD